MKNLHYEESSLKREYMICMQTDTSNCGGRQETLSATLHGCHGSWRKSFSPIMLHCAQLTGIKVKSFAGHKSSFTLNKSLVNISINISHHSVGPPDYLLIRTRILVQVTIYRRLWIGRSRANLPTSFVHTCFPLMRILQSPMGPVIIIDGYNIRTTNYTY